MVCQYNAMVSPGFPRTAAGDVQERGRLLLRSPPPQKSQCIRKGKARGTWGRKLGPRGLRKKERRSACLVVCPLFFFPFDEKTVNRETGRRQNNALKEIGTGKTAGIWDSVIAVSQSQEGLGRPARLVPIAKSKPLLKTTQVALAFFCVKWGECNSDLRFR